MMNNRINSDGNKPIILEVKVSMYVQVSLLSLL